MTHGEKENFAIELPSGAFFPEWGVVFSNNVRASLRDTLGVLRMTRRWGGIGKEEDKLRQSILLHYAGTGRAPTRRDLAYGSPWNEEEVDAFLIQLSERDLVVLDPLDGRVVGAYPFTDSETEHRVLMGGVEVQAMCAIDALGVGAMLDIDIFISSKCRHCGCDIAIETNDRGKTIRYARPNKSIVWSGIREIDSCAADTQCQVMAYFCSDDHLEAWKIEQEEPQKGHRLSIEEGLQAGAAIFIPFLSSPGGDIEDE